MYSLFQFLYRNRAFFIFLLLEVISFWLIINDRSYLSARFFNSSNRLAASVHGVSAGISEYFSLRSVNDQLAEENRLLHEKIMNRPPVGIQLLANDTALLDTAVLVYETIAAKVINNSTHRSDNYITIDKGNKHGVEEGMGIIGPNGIVGKVKYTSANYASVISLLHSEFLISAVIKRNNVFGTVRWQGRDPQYSDLQFIPRHVELQVGDTIVSSGFNTIFPAGYMIGTIEEFGLSEDASFHKVTVKLATDFHSLSYVYVVKNILGNEKDSLELLTQPER